VIENPRIGEQVEFISESPELPVMDVRWTRSRRRALAHIHPIELLDEFAAEVRL
jgi:hypothetical protein